MEIKDEKFVSWPEVKNILEKKSEEKPLGYEQKNALEHLKKFSKISLKKSKELTEELSKISKLKDRHIAMIVSFLPGDEEDIKVLFSNEIINLTADDKKKILSAVKKYI